METPERLSADVLATLPPAVVATIAWQTEQIIHMTARVAVVRVASGFGAATLCSLLAVLATHTDNGRTTNGRQIDTG